METFEVKKKTAVENVSLVTEHCALRSVNEITVLIKAMGTVCIIVMAGKPPRETHHNFTFR